MSAEIIPIRGRPSPPIDVCSYDRAAIHEGVPIATLVAALCCRGLTVSNVEGLGLVIHQIGQDPHRPADRPLTQS